MCTHKEGPGLFDTHLEGPSIHSLETKKDPFPVFWTHTSWQSSRQVKSPGQIATDSCHLTAASVMGLTRGAGYHDALWDIANQ